MLRVSRVCRDWPRIRSLGCAETSSADLVVRKMAFSSRRELGMSGSLFVIQDPTELCESMAVGSMSTCDTPLGCSVFLILVFILFETVRMNTVDHISSSESSDLNSL
jgi:hypothetical protein